MISQDTVTDNVLTRPSRIRLMVSGMEGVFHLLAFSFCKGGRKIMMSLLIKRREVYTNAVE